MRFCGLGSGSRAAKNSRTPFGFEPLPDFPARIVALSVAQDHTALVDDEGSIYTFGASRERV